MPTAEDIRWFKEQFQAPIAAAIAGTPFDVDMLVAIACQETGHIWSTLRRKNMPTAQILALCVGDTLDDTAGRRAFPRNKAELIAAPKGQMMFDIARKALVDMAVHINGFAGVAANPNKFCHGYGVFQRDLQFFKVDPDYFLQRRYETFGDTLAQCLGELKRGLRKLGFENKASLSDMEFAFVAIAYNTGGFRPGKGLRQGHFDGRKFYGEKVFEFVRLAHTVAGPGGAPAIAPPPPGAAIMPPPTPVAAQGAFFAVETLEAPLRVRSEPRKSDPPGKNVVAHLPDGHIVRAVTGRPVNGFLEIETSLSGANIHGFCSLKLLVPAPGATEVPVVAPAAAPPTRGVVAVFMPRREGTVTKRTAPAGAHSLNEPDQPGRTGTTPQELVTEIGKIIDYLAVDRSTHRRYQPGGGKTFCNIYAHDFCLLAGTFLPRVWWTQRALDALAAGREVKPLIGDTIREMRANDLFRWLDDFGTAFGWRRTGTTTKLQEAANQGAIGLIVARRKEDGKSGHIVIVVPETATDSARRNPAGEVTAPLQSQAGATNFRRDTGRANWWNGEEFAESAFWVHA
ncbi:hypothetical protein GXW74_06630 [Roseomonas eburnea]|uniref:SH3 domain-containing protein n=1 Tax=Neoroseomonas eburnea TaxID=1346889 RepID=A0A9X9X8W9_9PROT|nr:hypothetical protein [Neoroseomonas eburnea]MBR0680155.1 hypothetical protein [Neoroseomonas eburnea]